MIVIDTSVLLAYFNTRDVNHQKARFAMESVVNGRWGKAILLECVFSETVSFVKEHQSALAAIQIGEHLRRVHHFDFIPTSDLFRSAWKEFQSDQTSRLDFTDHIVVLAARQRAGGKVLTFDPVFRDVPGINIEQ